MLPPRNVADVEREPFARGPASPLVRPPRPRFDLSTPSGPSYQDVARRPTVQSRVRPMFVVPIGVPEKLPPHPNEGHRNEQSPEALLLHRSDEKLNDGDAGGFAKEPETATDASPSTPTFVRPAVKLLALVGDDASRRMALFADRWEKKRLYLSRRRHRRKDGEADEATRELINDYGHPPAERSALR
jgi:hypothetical protein